jgi:putative PIN family toxin of toxin-antitoxin system
MSWPGTATTAVPRAVLDSSVLISAFLTPKGACAELLRAAERSSFVLCLSPEIIAEVARKLAGKARLRTRYGYAPADIRQFCDDLAAAAALVTDLPAGRFVPNDPKDDPIIATALAAGAAYLVTGDRLHLLPLGTFEGIRIVTPRAFLDLL